MPGLMPARLQRRVPREQIGAASPPDSRPIAFARDSAIAARRMSLGSRRAVFAHDVAVGKAAQKGEVDRERRPIWRSVAAARRPRVERRLAPLEDIGETSGVLPRDAVAVRRPRAIAAPSVTVAGCGDVVLLDASEPGRRRAHDGAKGELGVVDIERSEHVRERGRAGPRPRFGGGGERRAEQHDAEIGVAADRREGRLDGAEDARADRARRRRAAARPPLRRCARTARPSCRGRRRRHGRCRASAPRARRGRRP